MRGSLNFIFLTVFLLIIGALFIHLYALNISKYRVKKELTAAEEQTYETEIIFIEEK